MYLVLQVLGTVSKELLFQIVQKNQMFLRKSEVLYFRKVTSIYNLITITSILKRSDAI